MWEMFVLTRYFENMVYLIINPNEVLFHFILICFNKLTVVLQVSQLSVNTKIINLI